MDSTAKLELLGMILAGLIPFILWGMIAHLGRKPDHRR